MASILLHLRDHPEHALTAAEIADDPHHQHQHLHKTLQLDHGPLELTRPRLPLDPNLLP